MFKGTVLGLVPPNNFTIPLYKLSWLVSYFENLPSLLWTMYRSCLGYYYFFNIDFIDVWIYFTLTFSQYILGLIDLFYWNAKNRGFLGHFLGPEYVENIFPRPAKKKNWLSHLIDMHWMKNRVWKIKNWITWSFVYFKIDFCRLYRQ